MARYSEVQQGRAKYRQVWALGRYSRRMPRYNQEEPGTSRYSHCDICGATCIYDTVLARVVVSIATTTKHREMENGTMWLHK